MMKLKTLPAAIALASATFLTACGGSSGSDPAANNESPANPETPTETSSTQYSVAVSAPDSLQTTAGLTLPEKLQGLVNTPVFALDGSDLEADNFAVTVVDTAGNVVEIIEIAAENISQNVDGTWEISVPGEPRLDCLIVVNINAPIEITVGNPIPQDTLFTPTTSEDLEVDIATTAAYQNFLETLDDSLSFEALGFEPDAPEAVAAIEQLVDEVQQTYEDLLGDGLNPDDFSSVEALLEQVDETVATIVQTEIDNINNQVEGATLADLFSDGGGGLFWYEAELEEREIYLEYGQFDAPDIDIIYEWDVETAAWSEGETYSGTPDDDLVLTSTGWQPSADYFNITPNSDGTVTITDQAIDSLSQTVSATLVVDLEGLNIRDRLSVAEDTEALALLLADDAEFSAGASAYELEISSDSDHYSLWYEAPEEGLCFGGDPGVDVMGNCDRADLIDNSQWIGSVSELGALTSASAGTAEQGNIKGVGVSYGSDANIVAELVDGGAANFYSFDWSTGGYTSLGAGTWVMETNEGVEMIVLPIPADLQSEGDFDDDESTFIFAVQGGLVRKGNFNAAGSTFEEEQVYNAQANADINAAINPVFNDAVALYEYVNDEQNQFQVCNLNSDFQEDAGEYDGFGGPVAFNMANAPAVGAVTARAYDIVAAKCRELTEYNTQALEANLGMDVERPAMEFSEANVAGKTYETQDGESLSFNADGTGMLVDLAENFETPLTWDIEGGVLIASFSAEGFAGDSGEAYNVNITDRYAIVGGYYQDNPDTGGVQLEGLQLKAHFINDLWTTIGVDGTASAPGTPVLNAEQGDLWDTVWTEVLPE